MYMSMTEVPDLTDPPAPKLVRRYGSAETPPVVWRAQAGYQNIMVLPDRYVAYWGKPGKKHYGVDATDEKRPFAGIITHFTLPAARKMTDQEWTVRLVKYQHRGDMSRSGQHFGYHFYIDGMGNIYQGAPLTYRTNHIKPSRHPFRKPGPSRKLDNRNAIGISMVGGCYTKRTGLAARCQREDVTDKQVAAAAELVSALQFRFEMPCEAVYGHGEAQGRDRAPFEGLTVAKHVRDNCNKE